MCSLLLRSVVRCSSSRLLKTTRSVSYVLGIETSCDDTAAAVLTEDGRVLSSIVSSQWELNAAWKGIVPALAARAHADNLPHVINAAIEQSGLKSVHQLAAVAVTSGPGLAPCLDVGLQTARRICLENPDIVFLQINHLEAHVLVSRLPQLAISRPEFPFVVLLVSGGHCCLVLARGLGDYELLGKTVDDSIGEAYDKVARMLEITLSNGQNIHGGKLVEDMARRGNDCAFPFTEPMMHRKDCDFSYSGIKTAMLREVTKLGEIDDKTKEDLCSSFQRRAVDHLVTRTRRACLWSKERVGDNLSTLVVCGGVASNEYLRRRLQMAAETEGLVAVLPPAKYCTDNAVMVAYAGLERYAAGMRSDVETARYQPRWPLETLRPM
uniref:N(6)-L-threonylcarbamoyladenine synthase n=1 Tax=Peronospora matthiolae TaxID=2874970 RepID=A0AAV1U0A5_9STRA